jgi:hypothetical protein
MELMERNDAWKEVDTNTGYVNNLKAVSIDACRKLLGPERLLMLLSDPIRSTGPNEDSVYPWNVVDYLCNEDPRPNKRKELAQ